jgi:glycosidase
MEAGLPHICHRAALPYCYYDRYSKKIVLRLISSAGLDSVDIIYGDPHNYIQDRKQEGAPYVWRHEESSLRKQLSGGGQIVWHIELALPYWRRLKYGFRISAGGEKYWFSDNGLMPFGPEALREIFNYFFFPYIHEVDAPSVPQWVKDTVWYQIFPERFYNGNPSIAPAGTADWEHGKPEHANFFGGDIPGIVRKLGYLKDLGVTGIFLTPVFKSPSNHKYNTEDYFTVDEHFGDLRDLRELVQKAHALGIRVMLDAVFNHIGETHPFWQDVLKNQEKSEYRDYFHIREFPVKSRYTDNKKMGYDTFGFTSRMPKWNTENPGAREYLLEAAEYWIRECDIDGWRLDVANEVSFDFWAAFVRRVRAVKDDFYILGEMWHDASAWINGGYFNAVMNYPLGFAVADFFLKKSIDADLFTERMFRALSRYGDLHNRAAFNLLDSHDTKRVLTLAGGDKTAVKNAFTLLFLLPGSPCIYYGTEIGIPGGEDPDNRRPMVWDEKKQDRELLVFFKGLIALRREYPAIINHGEMTYRKVGGLHCWELSRDSGRLAAVYTGDLSAEAGSLEKLFGRGILFTGQITEGNIPPQTVAVYYNGASLYEETRK